MAPHTGQCQDPLEMAMLELCHPPLLQLQAACHTVARAAFREQTFIQCTVNKSCIVLFRRLSRKVSHSGLQLSWLHDQSTTLSSLFSPVKYHTDTGTWGDRQGTTSGVNLNGCQKTQSKINILVQYFYVKLMQKFMMKIISKF